MEKIEDSKLLRMISNNQRESVIACKSFVEALWSEIILIKHYTKHDLSHSLRILDNIEKLPNIVKKVFCQKQKFIRFC